MLRPVARLVDYVLPYRNMASQAIIPRNINFNSKHLKKGDPLPPYNGKLRLYNMRFCPYAQRAVLALNAKNIDYEVVNIDLVEKPEWLTGKSPLAKVPSLEIKEDFTIYESLVLAEYLDEVYPERPLLPKDPVMKAYDKIIIEVSAAIHMLFFRLVKIPESVTDDTLKAYHNALHFIQEQLRSRGTTFLDGNEPGYADYMIWPWFERVLAVFNVTEYERLKIDPIKYKLLTEYLSAMLKDPIVSEYLIPNEVILEFMKGYKTGYPNYELLNDKSR